MVLEIGKYAKLRVVKEVDFGVYLDGGYRMAKYCYRFEKCQKAQNQTTFWRFLCMWIAKIE